MHKTNSFLLWTITVVITISVMFYQRMTGPTYPKKVTIELDGKEYQFGLLRSNEIGTPCDINLEVNDKEVEAKLYYKLYSLCKKTPNTALYSFLKQSITPVNSLISKT